MKHCRKNRPATPSSSALLLLDIDDELEGWADSDDHLAEENISAAVPSSELPETRQYDTEPTQITYGCMEESTTEEYSEAMKGEEEAWDDEDELFVSLMVSSPDEEGFQNTEEDQETETLFPDWHWGELDEFDPDDEEPEDSTAQLSIDPTHKRITLHDKSQRAAAKIIKNSNWEREEGLAVLTEVLVYHRCHPKTIGALWELTVEHQIEPDMLIMLHEIRSAWRSHGYNRVYSAFGARDGWANLPWGIALNITETLGVQSENEVMEFCEICFNDWCEIGFTEYPIFAYYLSFVVSTIDSPLSDTIHTAPDIARAMLTERGEQYDLPGNPVDKDLEYYGTC